MSVAPSLLFISGWGFHASLAKDFFPFPSIHLIDLPPLKEEEGLEEVCQAIESMVFLKEPILIGWSLGGVIALKLYERHPHLFKGLILLASTPYFPGEAHWPGLSKTHQRTFIAHLKKSYSLFSSYYLKLMALPSQASFLQSHLMSQEVFAASKAYDKIIFNADLRLQWAHINAPLLVIQGGKDPIVPYSVATSMAALNPKAQCHILPTAGHIPFLTHSLEVTKLIQGFFLKAL